MKKAKWIFWALIALAALDAGIKIDGLQRQIDEIRVDISHMHHSSNY